MKEPIKDDLGEPLVVDPAIVWSRIGIKVLGRKFTALPDLSTKKEMAPKVVIDSWIGEKIEEGGENKKN